MKTVNVKKHIVYLDILNIISCIAVIALHHNGMVHKFENTTAWKQSLVIECGCYWAVPIFIMISGATLMSYRKHYSTKTFFIKRIMRTVIPWLSWSIILLIWKIYTKQIILEAP